MAYRDVYHAPPIGRGDPCRVCKGNKEHFSWTAFLTMYAHVQISGCGMTRERALERLKGLHVVEFHETVPADFVRCGVCWMRGFHRMGCPEF